MSGDLRWWWKAPGQERFRCKAERKDESRPARCSNKAMSEGGYCKMHATLVAAEQNGRKAVVK